MSEDDKTYEEREEEERRKQALANEVIDFLIAKGVSVAESRNLLIEAIYTAKKRAVWAPKQEN